MQIVKRYEAILRPGPAMLIVYHPFVWKACASCKAGQTGASMQKEMSRGRMKPGLEESYPYTLGLNCST